MSRSTHSEPQTLREHDVTHSPSTQNSSLSHATRFAHVVPHVATEFKFVSQPSSGPLPSSALQSANPPLHVGSHCPESQAVLEALSVTHARAQAPQFARSDAVSTQSEPHSVCSHSEPPPAPPTFSPPSPPSPPPVLPPVPPPVPVAPVPPPPRPDSVPPELPPVFAEPPEDAPLVPETPDAFPVPSSLPPESPSPQLSAESMPTEPIARRLNSLCMVTRNESNALAAKLPAWEVLAERFLRTTQAG
jgi:hypothetical protein